MWPDIIAGKTVVGALLGDYVGVELAKQYLGYRKYTGDRFAAIVPLAIALGRVGCMVNRCCSGVQSLPSWCTIVHHDGTAHWPASMEYLGYFTIS